jgi:hypothetical protein
MDNGGGIVIAFAVVGAGLWAFSKLHSSASAGLDTNLPGNYAAGEPTNFYNPAAPGQAVYVVPGGAFLLS